MGKKTKGIDGNLEVGKKGRSASNNKKYTAAPITWQPKKYFGNNETQVVNPVAITATSATTTSSAVDEIEPVHVPTSNVFSIDLSTNPIPA